jgi:hypothetical protein
MVKKMDLLCGRLVFSSVMQDCNIQHCISHHNLAAREKKDGGGFDLDQGTHCVHSKLRKMKMKVRVWIIPGTHQ